MVGYLLERKNAINTPFFDTIKKINSVKFLNLPQNTSISAVIMSRIETILVFNRRLCPIQSEINLCEKPSSVHFNFDTTLIK